MSFKGKVALVTGGSRGVGKAISAKLADGGADVIINYFRKKSTAQETAREIEKKGVRVHLIKANLAEADKIDGMFVEIEEEFGRLDILINNAASGVARPALELDDRGWDWTMNVNAKAVLLCSQHAVKLMKDGGKIVNISSLGSRMVMPVYTAVGVSKAALEALTRYLAIEFAPLGICVNGISASAVLTEALKIYAEAQGLGDSVYQSTPAGRMVAPEDIADVVAFLCSQQSYMIRGQIIIIDGGYSVSPSHTNNAK
ncbi:MAG: enoyl-[acyl-carrier-protein] reductase FabL [Chloroflexi bacterium]|nr:enoyl-[acyl-carrier-protein] reductase FabL [Chloroflexota bacterium]